MHDALAALLALLLGASAPAPLERPPAETVQPADLRPADLQPADLRPATSFPATRAAADAAAQDVAGVMRLALERYVEPVDAAALAEGAKSGLASSLDPWSEYLPAADAETMRAESEGDYCGIGVAVSEDMDGAVLVDYPEPDSPAFRAGLRMDDRIFEIDGEAVSDLGFDEAIERIGGPEGSEVELAWLEAETGVLHRAKIRREALSVPTVQAARRDADGVGYLYLAEFEERTPRELRRALRALGPATLRGLVLDLRDDPGGDVEAAVAAASLFLPRGALVARTRGRLPAEDDHDYRSRGGEAWPGLRLALLVNDESASAAELFAAALRDHGRAPLVGGRTFGKALVQSLIPLSEEEGGGPGGGAVLKLTTARYYTPSGALIHGRGLEPDLPVEQDAQGAFDVVRARLLAVRPDLASPDVRARLLAAPDAPLAAARAWILSGEAPPAARPEAPPRLSETTRNPVRK